MGNFISAQTRYSSFLNENKYKSDSYKIRTAESIIFQFDVIKWNNRVSIVNFNIIPIFNLTYKIAINNKIYNGYTPVTISSIVSGENEIINRCYNKDILKKLVSHRLVQIKKMFNSYMLSEKFFN